MKEGLLAIFELPGFLANASVSDPAEVSTLIVFLVIMCCLAVVVTVSLLWRTVRPLSLRKPAVVAWVRSPRFITMVISSISCWNLLAVFSLRLSHTVAQQISLFVQMTFLVVSLWFLIDRRFWTLTRFPTASKPKPVAVPTESSAKLKISSAILAAPTDSPESDHLKAALQAGKVGTWNWNLETNLVEFDATLIEITGLGKRDNFINITHFLERVHREDREALEKALESSLVSKKPYFHTFRLYVPGRGYRWLQGRGGVHDDNGSPAKKMVGVNFDITDQLSGQEALRVRNRAIEFATNGILITDARSENIPIIYANPAFEELTGFQAEEVLGKNCRFLQGPNTDPMTVDLLRDAVRRHEECEVTILNYRKDGTPFWNNLHIAPVSNDEGVVTHFVGVQTDITDRVENERRLMEAQVAAEAANRAKGEFLANMSHEIRTPLTAILGCADSLCRELYGEAPRETAKTIRSQGELLLGILNDILDLSKIEAGKLEINSEACSVLSILADVRSLMDPQATEKGLVLETCFDTRLPELIHTDPLRLRQILLNLTGNAIKFTEAGHVELRASCTLDDGVPILSISVKDTGAGIPKNRLRAIFDAFTQADNSVVRRVGGTGLGLTICQRLVHMLGGELTVESTQGVGSVFTMRLPLKESEVDELFTVEELTERRHQKESNESLDILIPARVLIAEDTKAIQFMLQRMLQPIVEQVVVVNNGAEAVDVMQKSRLSGKTFDLILMDMQMPQMNGYDATARLRSQGETLPIIALTAGAMAGDRERCLAVGCTDYLSKPVSRGQLMAMIVAYCNQAATKPR